MYNQDAQANEPLLNDPHGSFGVPDGQVAPSTAMSRNQGRQRSDQPQSVLIATRLMWFGAVLALILPSIQLVSGGAFSDDLGTLLLAGINGGYGMLAFEYTLFLGLPPALCWMWMAWMNGQGKNWARIVSSILGILGVLTGCSFVVVASGFPLAVSLVALVLPIVVLVFLWKPESTRFFQSSIMH